MIHKLSIALFLLCPAFIFLALVFPAHAERQYKGGMAYTTIAGQDGLKKSTSRHLKVQEIPGAQPAQPADEDISTEIWNRYKALAAGLAGDEKGAKSAQTDESDGPDDPDESGADTVSQSGEKPVPAGLSGIIQRYKANRKARRQMQSLTVSPPERPEKPIVEAE